MTYPSGRVVKHEYDAIGRVQNVKNNTTSANYASSAGYNTASQLTGFSYGNSISASFGYSANRLQLSSVAYSNSGNLFSLSYGYSQSGANNGQIASVTDNVDGGRTASYSYDARKRLATAGTSGSTPYPAWGLSWTYDDYGNRTAQSVTAGSGPSNSVSVSTSTNRITGMGGYTFYYDSSGNLTQDDLYKFKYDAEHRLVEIRNLSNTLISSYAFDGHSLRSIKVVGADRTWYLYAGTQLVSEFEDAASANYSAGTQPGGAGSDSTATLLYQHGDHLTTRLTTDNSGQLSNQQAHYPYGEQWYATGTANPSVERKFTSYLRDDEVATGRLNYAVFREHSARVARFLTPDPVQGRGPQGLNRYSYVTNNPVNRTDPRGLDPVGIDELPLIEGQGWISPSGTQAINASGPTVRHTGDTFWDWGPGTPFPVSQTGVVLYPGMGVGGPIGGVSPVLIHGGNPDRPKPKNPCNCAWWDLICKWTCEPVETGCTVEIIPGPAVAKGGTNRCLELKPLHVLVESFRCGGNYQCCEEKMKKFISDCQDKGPGHSAWPLQPFDMHFQVVQCCKDPGVKKR